MIDFSLSPRAEEQHKLAQGMATSMMRSISRETDEREGEPPSSYVNFMWQVTTAQEQLKEASRLQKAAVKNAGETKPPKPSIANMVMIHLYEALSWGDVGLYLSTPSSGLAGFAIDSVGTAEQKDRFLTRFREGEPKWGAMAITEAHAGSDTANIRTTARLDAATNEWVLNGEKIFITAGKMAGSRPGGLVVVWATVDASAGRAGIKSFVVEAGTPGFSVTKTEHKLGIRASDTAVLVFQDCRIPYDNILGSPEVVDPKKKGGFKGVMKTFDASRPAVAATAMGVARAAIEVTHSTLKKAGVTPRYDVPRHQLSAVERDLMDMRAKHKAAWLLTKRAAWMADQRQHNALQASMCKAKAGSAVTWITQKAVELLGPLGYSRELLVEKWMRDAKINDIYEGTYQINLLIVARRLLGFSRDQLK